MRWDMSDKLIGMYVLMMWAYNYPYAARTWRLKDWSAYLEGLRALGYNLVQIWPFVDAIPVPMTPSDRVFLTTLRQVIDVAHELGMTVYIGSCANTMANELMSSTNVLTDVTGISNTSAGNAPPRLFPWYTRYVAISDPKNMQSEPRNAHMSIFLWFSPVVVASCSVS